MLPIDEMIEQTEIQDGVNTAVISIIQVLACAIAAKLPDGKKWTFQAALQDVAGDEELTGELSENGKQAFNHVANNVASAVENFLSRNQG